MDDCISNLVVTENYVVQPVESIPISMVDCENIGIAHLVHSAHPMHGGPVIRLTPINPPIKTNDLHPLEAEIERDFALKQHFSRQHSSVIQTVPECSLESVVKRSNQYMQIQQKPQEVISNSITVVNDGLPPHQVINNEKSNVVRNSDSKQEQHVAIPQILEGNQQMILQGKQYIIVPENSQLINSQWKTNKNETDEISRDLNSNSDLQEMSDIPLTVQDYNNSSASCDNTGKNVLKQESDSEDEGEEIEPVCDYEPDPEPSETTEVEDAGKPNKCYMCFKSFRQKKNMYAHIRKIHSTQPKIEGGILCPLCKMHALRQEHLRNHFETLHDVKIEKEEKLFNNMEEFLSWKEYVERETLSLYVSKSSAKLLANNQQKTYYKCHRSGNYITVRKENRKKKLKIQGSNKIGATCPAAMEVTENVHGVNVIFWKTHVGHDNDLAHLVLSKEDKARISEFLNTGVPWDRVLEKIKKEAEKSPNVPSRLTMVSKQDLRNIKKVHDMKNCPELFPARKRVSQGRKPMKERMLRRASQSLVIEKADLLLNLLETTEILPEFRPKVCLMIDNLISTIKRRAVTNIHKREKNLKKKRKKQNELQLWTKSIDHRSDENGDSVSRESNKLNDSDGDGDVSENSSVVSSSTNPAVRKRGRPKKHAQDGSLKILKFPSSKRSPPSCSMTYESWREDGNKTTIHFPSRILRHVARWRQENDFTQRKFGLILNEYIII